MPAHSFPAPESRYVLLQLGDGSFLTASGDGPTPKKAYAPRLPVACRKGTRYHPETCKQIVVHELATKAGVYQRARVAIGGLRWHRE